MRTHNICQKPPCNNALQVKDSYIEFISISIRWKKTRDHRMVGGRKQYGERVQIHD